MIIILSYGQVYSSVSSLSPKWKLDAVKIDYFVVCIDSKYTIYKNVAIILW